LGESTYDEIAAWYDAWAGSSIDDDPFFRSAEALIGGVSGTRGENMPAAGPSTDKAGGPSTGNAGLRRLIDEGAVAQLTEGAGRMAQLGSEDGVPKLDWVMATARLLEDDSWLEEVEREAAEIWDRGTRHIIWSGMGGSVMAVRVLVDLDFCGIAADTVAIHPLDSTDPAALNAVLRAIAGAKGLSLHGSEGAGSPEALRELLGNVAMIGVSMGMTSEEPITHLEWFTGLLTHAGLPTDQHCLVMTLPGSYLDRFALEHGFPSRPLQLDGGSGTGGRMSAPTTRVFLLPAALALRNRPSGPGNLRAVLRDAWTQHDLVAAAAHPEGHPFVRLAAALSDAAVDGACRLLISASGVWTALIPWIEQLMEESLGKDGKGVVVFEDAPLNQEARCYRPAGAVRVRIGSETSGDDRPALVVPPGQIHGVEARLSALVAALLGWQLSMALYGYLQDIQFAGQPAVEDYKSRAKKLRTQGDPLQHALQSGAVARDGPLTLLAPPHSEASASPAALIAASLRAACPPYLDVTINGELTLIRSSLDHLGHVVLGTPIKLRRAPAAYHSTEQSEMDGPPGLMSIRILAREHVAVLLGAYDATFLAAQAVGSWQAMVEAGRACFLVILDGPLEAGAPPVATLLSQIAMLLAPAPE